MQSNKFQVLLVTAILAICLKLANGEDITCYQCYSDATETCITNPTAQGTVSCTAGCVTYQAANYSLVRGCADTIPESVLSSQVCQTSNCNTNLVCKECLGVNSCAIPAQLPNTLQVCSTDQTACITELNENSTVSRSCGVATTCTDATQCTSCTTGICNADIYPADRLQCYTCSGATCNTVTAAMLAPCGLTTASCYTIGTSDATMQRGCTSETDAKCTAGTTDANCLLCNEKECNNLTYNRDGGSCVTCSGCAGLQEASQGVACGNTNYTTSVGCFTQTVGDAVNRGCLNALSVACTNANQCTSCNTTNCNIEASFTCLRCNSYNDPKCAAGSEVTGTPCDNESDQACFAGLWGDLVVRDCLDQASELMQYQCYNKLYSCDVCKTTNCNTWSLGGASLIQVSLGLIVASLGFLFIRLL